MRSPNPRVPAHGQPPSAVLCTPRADCPVRSVNRLDQPSGLMVRGVAGVVGASVALVTNVARVRGSRSAGLHGSVALDGTLLRAEAEVLRRRWSTGRQT